MPEAWIDMTGDIENISKELLTDLFSKISKCVDIDNVCHGNDIDGMDFLLNDGRFLSVGISSENGYGDCEHSLYFCVSDEDPRIWKEEMRLKYSGGLD